MSLLIPIIGIIVAVIAIWWTIHALTDVPHVPRAPYEP
jgi:hypothetical protein